MSQKPKILGKAKKYMLPTLYRSLDATNPHFPHECRQNSNTNKYHPTIFGLQSGLTKIEQLFNISIQCP